VAHRINQTQNLNPMESNKKNENKKKQEFEPIPEELNKLGRIIVESAFTVHKNLGPGLLEKVYEICFCYELEKRGINYVRQLEVPIVYDTIKFNEGLRLDVLVENSIICELKALENMNPLWEAQILSQMKITGKRLGFLINFNVMNIGHGLRRFVL
jgi:GxxExxY protein